MSQNMRRLLDDTTKLRTLHAGGPGSGRHPEFGSFRKSGFRDDNDKEGYFKGTKQTYDSKKGTQVEVNRRPFEGGMRDVRTVVKENGRKVHDGSESTATKFLKSTYGIRYNSNR